MMTTITLPPIDADFPSITIRAARFRLDGSWDGAVAIVLTTGGASVSLDTRRLSPYEARAIGMATGRTLLLRGQGEPIVDTAVEVEPGVVIGARSEGAVFRMSLDAGTRATLWTGPTDEALGVAIALLTAGRGALDIDAFASPSFFFDNRTAFSPTWTGYIN